jgi:glycine cleavage system H lipoate-binding protein
MIVEGFYGQTVELKDDLLYARQELWVRPSSEGDALTFGVSQAGVILVSGFTCLEYAVDIGDEVVEGDNVAHVESYKAMITIQAPLSGRITWINEDLRGENVSVLETQCYEYPLFTIAPSASLDPRKVFLDVEGYRQALLRGESDHCGAGARVQRRSKH